MGTFHYGSWTTEFDDRTLTHLQIVIVQRLRRGEPLLMSWLDSTATGDGRSAMWITPGTPIFFKFSGPRVPQIDRDWLTRLDASAASSTGLIVCDVEGHPIHANASGMRHPHTRPLSPARSAV